MSSEPRSRLSHASLLDLLNGAISAVRVPGYLPAHMCSGFAERLFYSPLFGKYANGKCIDRIGQAFVESQTSDTARLRNAGKALQWIRALRRCCSAYATPIDRLRLVLDEVLPAGSRLASFDGAKMFTGLARRVWEGARAEPRRDIVDWDAPCTTTTSEISSQLTANVYRQMSEEGGELVLWREALARESPRA